MSELDAQALIQGVVMSEISKAPERTQMGLAVTPPLFSEETEKRT